MAQTRIRSLTTATMTDDTDKASAASLISNSIPSLPRGGRRSSFMITNNNNNQNNSNDNEYSLTLSSSSTTKSVTSSTKSKSIDDILSVPDPPTPQSNDDDNSLFISSQEETEMILKHSRQNRRNSRRLSSGGGIGVNCGSGSDKENESIFPFVFSSLPSPKKQNGSTNDNDDNCDEHYDHSPGKTMINKEVDDSNMDWEDDNSNIHYDNDNEESNFCEGSANHHFQHHNDDDNQSNFLPGKESIYLDDSSDENDEDDINQQHPMLMSRTNLPPSFAHDKKKRRSSFMIQKDTTMTLSSEAASSASTISEPAVSKRHKRNRQSIELPLDNYNSNPYGNNQLINTQDNEESIMKIHFDDDDDESDVVGTPQKKRKTNSRRSMVIPDQNELLFGDANGNGSSNDRNDNDSSTSHGGGRSANDNTKMKPKKARTSILLNKIDFDQSNEVKEDSDEKNQHHLLHKSDTKDKIIPKSPSSYYDHWKKVCPEKLKLVKESIRKFCSLPVEERYKSVEAITVEELSGYPLLNQMEKARRDQKLASKSSLCDVPSGETDSKQQQLQEDDDEEERRLINVVKREIVTQMGSLIPIMEARKKEDTEMMEAGTGCRVERRRGKFKYIDKTNGKKVSIHEYEKRYLCTLQQHRVLREARIEANNRADDETFEIIPVFDEESTSDESLPVEEERKRLCDDDENNENIDVASCNDTNQDIRHTAQDAVEEGNKEALIQLADIPSRDDISDDPEIAAAQQELFDTFDAALQKYSDKILEIRERRKMG